VDAKSAANWLNNEVLGRLNRDGLSITEVPVSAAANNTIIQMVTDKTISGKIAKDLLDIVWKEGGDPRQLVEARGLRQVTDTGAIDAAIEAVIAANPDKVEEVKAKPKLAAWFVGQVMKQTGGKASPAVVNAALKTRLNLPEEG
jgi:aspartyl-tRNA(Asn)/glutamyl-tRNA(Gln) amidotransferase subunit B